MPYRVKSAVDVQEGDYCAISCVFTLVPVVVLCGLNVGGESRD